MGEAVRECNRYIVQHHCCGQWIINQFKTYAEADNWYQYVLGLNEIAKVELIGITEEQHLLKGWVNNGNSN